jgi:formiminotetrahydrofolate cyclodeaminase
MAAAALESALINIEVNRALITDESVRKALAGEIETAGPAPLRAAQIVSSVREAIRG